MPGQPPQGGVVILCDRKCNECQIIGSRNSTMVARILQVLDQRHDDVHKVVQSLCPNLTCCPACHCDDFAHVEGCQMAKALNDGDGRPCEACGLPLDVHQRCPRCGYTACDCAIHGDHALCGRETPDRSTGTKP